MTRPLHAYGSGEPRPLGATLCEGGVNFALYSEHASAIDLLLYDRYDDDEPRQTIRLSGRAHRTVNTWHVFVAGIGAGQLYGYRVHGPSAPEQGLRFDPEKVLVDPYARGIVYGDNRDRRAACSPGPNDRCALKSLVVDPSGFDWGESARPKVAATQRVIYELHVRGFTRHPSSGVTHPGTFAGLMEKIPYLVDLGVTTVELLPVFQFDELAPDVRDPGTGERLRDYWGYNPIGFFAPHRGYYTRDWEEMAHLTGFRDLVRALHQAGLEVLLDVVFNHTSEGDAAGPTLSFKGIDNPVYYMFEPGNAAGYANYSGCGNTVNCNHPAVRRMILDSLRYWTGTMRVDGFRFDLASILSRDADGRPLPNPPLLWEIENDPALADSTLIAEAWDAGGLYQVGAFPGERWREWNGRFRDDVRSFLRGDPGTSGAMARRMLGSPDLYEGSSRRPPQGVNFVTAHDGFTLADLVAYERKHNEANGEGNRDGSDHEHSENHGVEGPTDDPRILAARARQVRNLLTALFVAQGTPMLLAGDELGRTQGGNNNAWCQDNDTTWLDWGLLEANADLHRFTRADPLSAGARGAAALPLPGRLRRPRRRRHPRLHPDSMARDAGRAARLGPLEPPRGVVTDAVGRRRGDLRGLQRPHRAPRRGAPGGRRRRRVAAGGGHRPAGARRPLRAGGRAPCPARPVSPRAALRDGADGRPEARGDRLQRDPEHVRPAGPPQEAERVGAGRGPRSWSAGGGVR